MLSTTTIGGDSISELWLLGEPGAIIFPTPTTHPEAGAVLLIAEDAPPVHIHGLTFADGLKVAVYGSEVDFDQCVFDGNGTQAHRSTRRQLQTSEPSTPLSTAPLPSMPPSPPFLPDRALSIYAGSARLHACTFVSLEGGAILVSTGGALSLTSCVLRHNTADMGGALLVTGGLAVLSGTVLITTLIIPPWMASSSRECPSDGLLITRMTGTVLEANEARLSGGALQVEGGVAVLRDGSLINGSHAPVGGGRSLRFSGGELRYELPTPRARWVFITDGSNTSTLKFSAIDVDWPFNCPAGVFASTSDPQAQSSPSCEGPCPEGFSCWESTATPEECPRGSYCPLGSPVPLECPAGTFNPTSTASAVDACVACRAGSMCPRGSSHETPCPRGHYAPKNGTADCVRCALGTYMDALGAISCRTCPEGKWCSTSAAVACPSGFYNPLEGQDSALACIRCPPNSGTLAEGATRRAQCVCDAWSYDADPAVEVDQELLRITADNAITMRADAVDCQSCTVGVDCSRPGSRLGDLDLSRGFWRPSGDSRDVRRCPDASVGCMWRGAFSSVCQNSLSGCRGGPDPDALCVPGSNLSGAFCRLCPNEIDGMRVYYKAARAGRFNTAASCASCEGEQVVQRILSMYVVVAIAAVLVWVVLLVAARRTPAWIPKQARRLWRASTPSVKLKSVIGFYIIVTKIEDVYEVSLPSEVRQLLSNFLFGITLGIGDASDFLTCIGLQGFRARLVFWMVVPLLVVALIVVATLLFLLVTSRSPRELLYHSLPIVIRFLFLIYPLVSNVAFECFSYYDFAEDGLQYLQADVAIIVRNASASNSSLQDAEFTDEYQAVRSLAWIAVGMYPFFLLVVNGALLFSAREAILSRRDTPLSRAILFLYQEYEPWAYWWELMEMARRVVLVGIFVLVQRGSVTQLVMAILFCAIYLLLQTQV